MNIKIKASVKQYTEEHGIVNPEDIDSEPVTFHIKGDEESMVDEQIYLGGRYYTDNVVHECTCIHVCMLYMNVYSWKYELDI